MANMLLTVTIGAALLYCALCAFLFFMQGRLLYYPNIPSRELTASPADIGLEYESVTITASDGVKIHGWYLPGRQGERTILFFHGNAGNISHRLDSLKIFHDLGLSAFIIDYRGYGRSQGHISEPGTYLDAEAAWNFLTLTKEVPPGKIVIFGRSLGGAVAAYIAAGKKPAALILESAFTSVPDMGARLYPFIPVRILSRYQYNTRKALRSVSCPLLVVHSRDDDIIPFEHGVQLYESGGAPKRFLEIRGDHNQGFLYSGRAYIDGIAEFIKAYAPRQE